jgi:hypothetical protein
MMRIRREIEKVYDEERIKMNKENAVTSTIAQRSGW